MTRADHLMRADIFRAFRNVALLVGLAGLLALAFVALFGARLTPSDPQAQRLVLFFPDGTFKVPPSPPDPYYPLGTDALGRDQLARLLWGARLTFTVVLLALGLRTALSVVMGIAGGWRRGAVAESVTVMTNAVAGIPQLLLALLIAVLLRDQAILGFVMALGCVGWAEGAQFVRAEVERIRRTPYIEAATAIGGRTPHILTTHVLRGLAPQLFGLVALEAGATLLLLAELGFLGVFMSGYIVQLDDNNRPVLPVRDRAPEWGQMLAGATAYAFSNQYVAFVPGVVVAAAVFIFNVLGEGARMATDPFSSLSLSPRALGALGRALLVFALVLGTSFGVAEARSTQLSFEDAMRLAREANDRFEPGDEMIAAVVRFASDSHAMTRPSKYNFYFRQPGGLAFVRVGFPDADQNAMEIRRFDDEDNLLYRLMTPPKDATLSSSDALAKAESQGGTAYRSNARGWLVRVVLTGRDELTYYRALYTPVNGAGIPAVDVVVDARTGDADSTAIRQFGMRVRAETMLGGEVVQSSASGTWRSTEAPAAQRGFGAEKPLAMGASFNRIDLPSDLRTAFVSSGSNSSANIVTNNPRIPALSAPIDVVKAFAAVEAAGGRDARATTADWIATVNANMQSGALVVIVFYTVANRGTSLGQYRYDPITGAASRTGP